MGQYNYFPANSTPEQKFGLTQFVSAIAARIVIIVGHGQGECNNGDLAGCKFSSGWGGWYWLKIVADLFGADLIFINTSLTSKYSLKEYQFARDWIEKHYPPEIWANDGQNVWVLGHSLGSYGAGRYAFIDLITHFSKRVAGWIISASGPWGSGWTAAQIAALMQALKDAGVKIWGVTAANDLISGTSPKWTNQFFAALKALDHNYPVIISEFPATEWPNDGSKVIDGVTVYGSKAAHNNVLGRIFQKPIGIPSAFTKGIPLGLPFRMTAIEWMISNPRRSVYQHPTDKFIGPKWPVITAPEPSTDPVIITPPTGPAPTPTAVYIKDMNWAMDGKAVEINWRDGSTPLTVKSPTPEGKIIKNVYDREVKTKDDAGGHVVLTFTYADGSTPRTIAKKGD